MIGRRIYRKNDDELPIAVEKRMEPGDYCEFPEPYNFWLLCAPNGDQSIIRGNNHKITVEADGTLTLSPSIQFMTQNRWHGYLVKGVWSEV